LFDVLVVPLSASVTTTTLNPDIVIEHGAWEGLLYDVKHLPGFWPAGIAFVALVLLLRLKRRQDRQSPARRRGRGPVFSTAVAATSRCALCGDAVSAAVRDYCLARPSRFGAEVYCYTHQRRR